MEIEISAIIACRNEEKDIPRCLDAIARQTLAQNKWEVIFVDGGSTDNTLQEIRKYSRKIKNIKTVNETGEMRSAANARNIGAKIAHGKILAFFDADNFIERDYLLEIERGFSKGIDAASQNASGLKITSVWAHLKEHETKASNYLVKSGEGIQIVNIFTKKCFKIIGGYDPEYTYGEDMKILDKLRQKKMIFVNLPNAKVLHKEPDTLYEIERQSNSWGKGFYRLFKSDPKRHLPRLLLVCARALWLPLLMVYFAFPFNLLLFIIAIFYLAAVVDGIVVFYRSMKMGGKIKYASLLIPFRMIRSYYFLRGFSSAMIKKY